MNANQKIKIYSNAKLLQDLDIGTAEGYKYAKSLIDEMYSIVNIPTTTMVFSPCSNSIVEYNVDYNCPERAQFINLVDSSL